MFDRRTVFLSIVSFATFQLLPRPAAAQHVAPSPVEAVCRVVQSGIKLPEFLRETSGLARSSRDPNVFWTHNDGNKSELFSVDGNGQLLSRVRLVGAPLTDWEDIETGRCGSASCLYIADIGDNNSNRQHITIYRIEEPAIGAATTAHPVALQARYPDGARDAEAFFSDNAGNLYIVTKGRESPVALYRYRAQARPMAMATLERVRELFPLPSNVRDRVTAATSSPNGKWIGVRTYRTLYLYDAEQLLNGGAAHPRQADLSVLSEAQGEALVLSDDGDVWVTSEAERKATQPRMSRLRCDLR